jgi:peroxiredoxin
MPDENQNPAAPEFTAMDSEGRTIKLSDYKRKKNIALVFNRGFF